MTKWQQPTPGWENGSTRQWRKKRRRVLERDRYRCQLRLPGCKTRADCVHHLDGKALGDDESRLVAACTPCNLKVGDPGKVRHNHTTGGLTVRDPEPRQATVW